MPRAAAAIVIGSTPGTQRSRPSRVSSPIIAAPASGSRGHRLVRRGEHRHRDREVEVRAALGQVGRREQHRRPPGVGPGEAAVGDRRPAAVAGLGDRGVGPADQGGEDEARRTGRPGRRRRGPSRPAGRRCAWWRPSADPPDVVDLGGPALGQEHADEVDADPDGRARRAPRASERRASGGGPP